MTDYLFSSSKTRLLDKIDNNRFSPNVIRFLRGLNSDNSFFDKGALAALGIGSKLFFCFGVYDADRSLELQAKFYCHGRNLRYVWEDSGDDRRIKYVSSDTKFNNGISPNPNATVTNAKAGASFHNWGLAVDVYLCNSRGVVDWSINYSKIYEQIGLVAWGKACRLKWGGSWADNGHFEDSIDFKIPDSSLWTERNVAKAFSFFSSDSKKEVVASSSKREGVFLWILAGLGALLGLFYIFRR